MSHELTELHFPLPAAPSATFTSLWMGNETHFQEVPPHLFPNVLQGRLQQRTAPEKTRSAATHLLATMTLDSVLGPQLTFKEGFDWHSRGYFGEYGGSGRYFWSDLLAAHPELSTLLVGMLQSTLGRDAHAATPASPRPTYQRRRCWGPACRPAAGRGYLSSASHAGATGPLRG